ncbi:GGDEF domain-containing protein [Paenibacillus albiflavus]|uniref:GGDEF domain-containing protein n=1 Tax=Paenibacillus albiflavus TaxID=2545760 RepID=A0A4R4E9V3_9BACL|nr:diguanylate cyclase [Paenibacillus albiflavus]TCZ75700.1 GGDEF domain-containing protein [Paenibacillus albiflavus]
MRRNQSSLLSDSAFLLLFILCFVSIIVTSGDGDQSHYLTNIIVLNIAFLIAIITYFFNLITGLVLNIIFIFGYGSFILYQTLVIGTAVESLNYFWLVITPLFTVITWAMTLANKRLQAENARLQKRNEILATVDENTNLKNTRSFHKDAEVFMALSTRYQIPITLLMITVKYWDELKRMINEDQMNEIIMEISKLSETSVRMNDSLYMFDNVSPTWGLLLFTEHSGADIVIERIKQKIDVLNANEFADNYKIHLQLRIGAIEYNPDTISSPLDFIVQAKGQLEYDV